MAVGSGKITDSQAQARGNEVGGVHSLATQMLPNDSLTWHLLWPVGHISARSRLPISRRRYQEPTENDPTPDTPLERVALPPLSAHASFHLRLRGSGGRVVLLENANLR
jgi:hypothetical protein